MSQFVPRTLTEDELKVIEEARNYCVKADKATSHFNIRSAIRRFYPGRGKALSDQQIKYHVLNQPSE